MNRFCVLASLSFVSLLILSLGCGGSGTVKAGGTVKVDGKLVTGGSMQFYPVGGGRPASAKIEKDGSFVISYRKPGDGLPPGNYKVAIVSDNFIPNSPNPESDDIDSDESVAVTPGRLISVVPKIYNEIKTTPLEQKVEEGQTQVFDYDIPSN